MAHSTDTQTGDESLKSGMPTLGDKIGEGQNLILEEMRRYKGNTAKEVKASVAAGPQVRSAEGEQKTQAHVVKNNMSTRGDFTLAPDHMQGTQPSRP